MLFWLAKADASNPSGQMFLRRMVKKVQVFLRLYYTAKGNNYNKVTSIPFGLSRFGPPLSELKT